jgi:hypothetical protein
MDAITVVINQYSVNKTNIADAVLIPNVIKASFILSSVFVPYTFVRIPKHW